MWYGVRITPVCPISHNPAEGKNAKCGVGGLHSLFPDTVRGEVGDPSASPPWITPMLCKIEKTPPPHPKGLGRQGARVVVWFKYHRSGVTLHPDPQLPLQV